MKSKFINVVMFAAGAAIGSAVTYKVLKTKYDQLIQVEIDSVKETFAEQLKAIKDEEIVEGDTESDSSSQGQQINWAELEDLDEEEDDENAPNAYEKIINSYNLQKGGADEVTEKPYVISPYDFGEIDEYHQIELTYYADGVLEDEDYNIVTDVDELVGATSLYKFGEYEDDAVFVRNDRLKTDFQILQDYRTHAEALAAPPNQVGNR